MKNTLFVMLIAAAGAAFAAEPAEPDHAPAHYRQACVACHAQMVGGNGDVLYTRDDRNARDYQALKQRVAYCRDQLGLQWSAAQSDAVVEYLNTEYYHHPPLR